MSSSNKLASYLITDPKYYSDEPSLFSHTLTKALIQYKPDFACFRDKRAVQKNAKNLQNFVRLCKEYSVVCLINSDLDLALKYGFDGVHLPSSMIDEISEVKSESLVVIASTHNHEEVQISTELGADAITLSPVFASPDKGVPLGVERFDEIMDGCSLKVFALGGIVNDAHVEMIKNSKAYGFASIRYFVN